MAEYSLQGLDLRTRGATFLRQAQEPSRVSEPVEDREVKQGKNHETKELIMKKILVIASVMLFGFIGANAAGTAAGTQVDNSASLSYTVSGVAQTAVASNTDSFIVDKKIDFALANNDGDQVTVVPGQTDATTTWSFRNEGNMDQNFTFTATELTGGETIYGDADTQDTNGPRTIEYNNGGTWTALSTLEIAVDTNITIRIRTDIDAARVNGDVMNIELKSVAVDPGGSPEVATLGADNKMGMDTVLAEGTGITSEGNIEHTNTFTRWGGYIVVAPTLDLTKLSCVLNDPVNSTTNPKRIPGATILYVFDINNTSATAATDVNLSDTLDNALDISGAINVKTNDGQSSCSCTDGTAGAGGTATSSVSGQNLKITGLTITGNKHNCVSFEAVIK